MKKVLTYILVLTAVIIQSACSTQKNTALSRSFHQTKTYYNIYYNGRLNYEEGLKAINTANHDDFSGILCMYPVSNHDAAKASASKMDVSIEKCRKCIKLHSIKKKPQKINPKRKNDPQYKLWLQSKEFNNKMYLAWLMLGQSEFHKGDFLGAIGTFHYVEKLYENDKDIVAQCQLWVARSYAELGWLYEAEEALSKVNIDNLKRKNQPFYSAVAGDIMLKQARYKDALPFVKIARESENRKGYRARFEYILGQLYQYNHQNAAAKEAYKRVTHLNPDPDLNFNANLHYAEMLGDTVKSVKQLQKLAKLKKNEDKQDQIFGMIGNIFLARRDTIQALKYYQMAIDHRTQPGPNKAAVLILAGDLHFGQENYNQAGPMYSEAIQLITAEHPDYKRVRHLAEVLEEVVSHTDVITLQDSLQYLSTLSEDEQLVIINQIIDSLKAQELADSLQAIADARKASLSTSKPTVNTLNMIGGNKGDNSWYFYNSQLVQNGRQQFNKIWGKRNLEDDWRRLSKSLSSSSPMMPNSDDESDDLIPTELNTDSTTTDDSLQTALPVSDSNDPHDPAYYLQQIPKNEDDIRISNELIAEALFHLVSIYRDKLGNQALSDSAFAEYCRRFPNSEQLCDLYYAQYLNALRTHNDSVASLYGAEIVRIFPNSEQTRIVSDPDYFNRLKHTAEMQDSVYEATYLAYRNADFQMVKANKQLAEDSLSLSPLMPRFLFLNAIAVAKTEGQDAFVNSLRDMVNRYPTNELGAMAKNMLAMMNVGAESKQDNSAPSTLAETRGTVEQPQDTIPADIAFSKERNESSYVLLIIPTDEQNLNRLLYEVALYNFTQFLIKDFDLMQLPYLTPEQCALQVAGLESLDEAEWYISLLRANNDINATCSELGVTLLPITDTNFKMLGNPFSPNDYQHFIKQ